ncbi:VOC family protein [Halospeciosus flavus]|uniref:VOC family protein n=1 Tax=Halospeciosus flavus TaxID=3032283 RepID=A0ABD5Z4M7_9EURY|nr:VOC family protein [Halospeciosus flavus]
MVSDTPGIHHVTGVAGDAQRNLDFYAGVLGLRLVKRTVNFEDMLQYHLYYGNRTGEVGTVLTTFPSPEADPGRVGAPQPRDVAFVVPPDSLDHWHDHLAEHDTGVERADRFDERVLRFEDPDGARLELVGGDQPVEPWTGGPVDADHAIRGIHGVTLCPVNPYATAGTLETLGFDLVAETEDRVRYRAHGDRANTVDVLTESAEYGREGTGTHHHVAVRVPDEEELYEWHDFFRERDYHVSRVKDRHFFHSLYVRGPGGVLFELATEPASGRGLAGAEDVEELGESLYLPPRFEEDRDLVESQLPDLDLPY